MLRRCLEALALQDHSSFEVIVVDDASSDATPAVLREVAAAHPDFRLRWLRNDDHAGANSGRNRAGHEARGEFVAFTDDDCVPHPDWLRILMRGFADDRVGAVTGTVSDVPPTNLYELAYRGTHRVIAFGVARRLVSANMAVRRRLLLELKWHEDMLGRCDEEGLFLMLRSLGYEIAGVADAIVDHEHHYNRRTFYEQAFQGGRAAARLVYKYSLHHRIDLAGFLLAYLSLPLVLLDSRLALVPAAFGLAALAAVSYNDLFLKGKTTRETLRSFPILLAYYHVRLAGYVLELVRLRCGGGKEIRRVELGTGEERKTEHG